MTSSEDHLGWGRVCLNNPGLFKDSSAAVVVDRRVDETGFKLQGKLHLPPPRAHLESINSSLASIVTNRPVYVWLFLFQNQVTLRRAFQFSLLVSIRDGTTRRTISRRTIWSAIVIGVSNPSHTPPSSHALKKLAVENHFYVAISSLSLSLFIRCIRADRHDFFEQHLNDKRCSIEIRNIVSISFRESRSMIRDNL